MSERRLIPQKGSRPDLRDTYEALAIARLRMMIARSEARKRRQDFAEARRLDTGAIRS